MKYVIADRWKLNVVQEDRAKIKTSIEVSVSNNTKETDMSKLNETIETLREAAYEGVDTDAQWQNLVDAFTCLGCPPEATFYLVDWWDVNGYADQLNWVCAQWFELDDDRWDRQFVTKFESVEWRYIVKTPELDKAAEGLSEEHALKLEESFYIQAHVEHTPENKMPRVNISWLQSCALANKKSEEHGYPSYYHFKVGKSPLKPMTSLDDGGAEVDGLWISTENATSGVRLPSKEEWIIAALAGRLGQDTPWGNHADFDGKSAEVLDPYCWFYENSGGEMHPVGEKEPNQWGIEGMLGNCFEFTSEEY